MLTLNADDSGDGGVVDESLLGALLEADHLLSVEDEGELLEVESLGRTDLVLEVVGLVAILDVESDGVSFWELNENLLSGCH